MSRDNGRYAWPPPKDSQPSVAKHWFSDEIIILSVRWYLRFKLSCRDLAQVMEELGVNNCTLRDFALGH